MRFSDCLIGVCREETEKCFHKINLLLDSEAARWLDRDNRDTYQDERWLLRVEADTESLERFRREQTTKCEDDPFKVLVVCGRTRLRSRPLLLFVRHR